MILESITMREAAKEVEDGHLERCAVPLDRIEIVVLFANLNVLISDLEDGHEIAAPRQAAEHIKHAKALLLGSCIVEGEEWKTFLKQGTRPLSR